jgi:type I restriction enzyme S subunit
MKPYESYNYTDQLWLQKVPTHWSMTKTKYLFDERSEKGYPTEPLLVASQNMGVVPKGVYGNRTVEATKDLHMLKIVKVGDFVISLRSFQGGIEYAYYQGIISPAYTIMIPKGNIAPDYFRHLAKSKVFIELLQLCVTGIREGQNIDYKKLKNFRLPVPPLTEQDQIVRFLDWKLSIINKLIKDKRKQISLFNEQKQAIINKAVTKGLDDTVQMRNSGIDWIGEIPQDWQVCRCKYLFREINLRSDTGLETHLSMSQKLGLVPNENLEERRMLSENYIGGKLCFVDNLVLNRLKAHLGVFALSKFDGVISPDYTVLEVNKKKVLPKFAEYVLRSNDCRRELRVRVRGVVEGFWRLYTDDFNNITLPLPSIEIQAKILNHLERIELSIERTKMTIERELDLLIEYKASLISSVVIGKLDVRGIVVPEFEIEDEVLDEETETFSDEIEASEVDE